MAICHRAHNGRFGAHTKKMHKEKMAFIRRFHLQLQELLKSQHQTYNLKLHPQLNASKHTHTHSVTLNTDLQCVELFGVGMHHLELDSSRQDSNPKQRLRNQSDEKKKK